MTGQTRAQTIRAYLESMGQEMTMENIIAAKDALEGGTDGAIPMPDPNKLGIEQALKVTLVFTLTLKVQ